jgi:hypothetical protein
LINVLCFVFFHVHTQGQIPPALKAITLFSPAIVWPSVDSYGNIDPFLPGFRNKTVWRELLSSYEKLLIYIIWLFNQIIVNVQKTPIVILMKKSSQTVFRKVSAANAR